ncbi:MAG TPA: zinc ribbon domain-containing protein [Oscillatoriales bacterium UBA8482]|nr:MAG: zinc ribbon domain-containing protein [Oscillatoriales cyanobacterium CG2_30_40_61]HBW57587.1 zinc ribbon domain-containing protein [Oscillatoriales bacterium UBA8482]
MAYVCQLGAGQSVYLENQAAQTVVTLISSGPGQQQQASSSFTTGVWTSPPQVFQTPRGMVLKVTSEQGERMLQIQGSSVSLLGEMPLAADSKALTVQEVPSLPVVPGIQPMEPMAMKPMEPMKPMNLKMGDMEMNMNPMSMQMGNMELRMGSPAAAAKSFCSQCGTSVQPEDRFCSNCGHQL